MFAANGGNSPTSTQTYVDDVFSSWLRTGTGALATVTTGIDLSTKGGCVWTKSRSAATGHRLMHTAIGAQTKLVTDTTAASASATQGLTAVSSTGHTIGTDTDYNNSTGPATYVDWVFRNADKFYGHTTVSKTAGSDATVSFANLGTLGMVRVKRTDSTGSWYVWHRSLSAGKLLIGETTAAEATLGHITVSGTTVTLVNGVIADGNYLVEAFAHDTSTDGIIQCGSFTTDGSGNLTTPVNLGWEPQFLITKDTGTAVDWYMTDSMREMSRTNSRYLIPNTSGVEVANGSAVWIPHATGFSIAGLGGANKTHIYLAIRRPNKPPTSGTQVYNAYTRTGANSGSTTVTGIGFAPDLMLNSGRTNLSDGTMVVDRLRGGNVDGSGSTPVLRAWMTLQQTTITGVDFSATMDGIKVWDDGQSNWSNSDYTYVYHFFKRAPGVFETFCDTGTGANKTETHGLSVAPELWLRKGRSGTTEWVWGSSLLANTQKIVMPSPNGVVTDATAWNSTYPTATSFSIGTAAAVNTNAATYVTYLWATKAGVSKVFTYTGDGGSGKVINCGFTAGARFILIIRTTASTAQDIFIWDSARGIIAGNDPHLSLNSTAAEVTTDDSVDPDNSGFAINQVAATNINVNGAVYIGVAYA